jgi:peptidoglycan/LPS O-acetylase OafA/YrhL
LLLMFIQWGQPLLKDWQPAQEFGIYWLWVIVAIIPFCFVFFVWVEKPGMKLGERFNRQRDGGQKKQESHISSNPTALK